MGCLVNENEELGLDSIIMFSYDYKLAITR
jgi:hypothetical protein